MYRNKIFNSRSSHYRFLIFKANLKFVYSNDILGLKPSNPIANNSYLSDILTCSELLYNTIEEIINLLYLMPHNYGPSDYYNRTHTSPT